MGSSFLSKNSAGEKFTKAYIMNTSELIREFQHCPICGQKLLQNPYYPEPGAMYCEEHGDFFAEHGRDGLASCIIFRPFRTRKRANQSYRKGKPDAHIKCVQTGIVYPNLKHICDDMGLTMANLSRHMQRNPQYRHVKGYTFVLVNPIERTTP